MGPASSFLTNVLSLHKVRTFALHKGLQVPMMKNVYEVLRQKELELSRLEKEVEALRVAAPLLSDEGKDANIESAGKPTLATPSPTQQPIRIPQPAVNATPQTARAAGWEDTAKRWP